MTREEAISLLTQVNKIIINNNSWLESTHAPLNIAFAMAIEALNAQKIGHWIDTGSGQECSECGEIQYGYDTFRHFCANCGAKMEVDK